MKYLALGDSISIDDYTGVSGGGAASQLAKRLRVDEFLDQTRDGQITTAVLPGLKKLIAAPDVITLTIGGNDFLGGDRAETILRNIREIALALRNYHSRVVINTVYDPTDGDDDLAQTLGITPDRRVDFNQLNAGIRQIAAENSFLLCDLVPLFHGHGIASPETWIVLGIEPNLAGATAIAQAWHALLAR